MSENILRNGDFEEEWSPDDPKANTAIVLRPDQPPVEEEYDNILNQPGWLTAFGHRMNVPDGQKLFQPEVTDAWIQHDERRVRSGRKGVKFFKSFARCEGAILRTESVEPGEVYVLNAFAHAWSYKPVAGGVCDGHGHCSTGVGFDDFFALEGSLGNPTGNEWDDGKFNFTFRLGIDPNGGTNPLDPGVIWGQGAHIYNYYHNVPEVRATALGNKMTVFLWAETKWGMVNNDAYWEDASLVKVGETPPDPEPTPTTGHAKLGPHVLRNAEKLTTYLQSGIRVAKFVDAFGPATFAPDDTLVVGRVFNGDFDAQHQYKNGLSAEAAAAQFIDAQLAQYNYNPHIIYWEGHNEPVWNTLEEMAWYSDFEIARMEMMKDLGLRCVIGNFSTGSPPLELWPGFVRACHVGRTYKAILGLHEYSTPWMWWMTGSYQIDPTEDQGDEGWTTLRYRKVYRQFLEPAGLGNFPLIITECGLDPLVSPRPIDAPGGTWKQLCGWWSDHDNEPDCAQYYMDQLAWYDQELQQDDYVIGATIFTWGSFDRPWSDFDVAGTPVADKLIDYARANPALPFIYPDDVVPEPEPGEDCIPPRTQYARTYVLLPQIEDAIAALDWRIAIAIGGAWAMYTDGHSADDAGVGPLDRTVLAVNPNKWDGDLRAFFDEHYRGAKYVPVIAGTPWELAVKLLAPLTDDIALGQNWAPWAGMDFGEHPGGGTIGGFGCFVTATAMVLRDVYGTTVTPPVLDKILVSSRAAFTSDNILLWANTVWLFPAFDDVIHQNRSYTAGELADLLKTGWKVILRSGYGDNTHFVYLESVQSGSLHIIDSLDGRRKVAPPSRYSGIRAAHVAGETGPPTEPPDEKPVMIGLHDESGGEWLISQGLRNTACLTLATIETQPVALNFNRLKNDGLTVICRVGWGYAYGPGTIARPHLLERHIQALADTMLAAGGVDYWVVWNEPNNVTEWPGFEGPDQFDLTPQYVTDAYNSLYAKVGHRVKLCPPPIDPYFGPGSNNADWTTYLWRNIAGAAGIALHAKTQTNDPTEVFSYVKFSDDPLKWQYLNMRVVETSLSLIGSQWSHLPVHITELNPQHIDNSRQHLGWLPNNAVWVHEAAKYFRQLNGRGGPQIATLAYYRYPLAGDQAPFALENKPELLGAIKEEAQWTP